MFVKLMLSPELPVRKGQTLVQVQGRMVVTVPPSLGGVTQHSLAMASMCSRGSRFCARRGKEGRGSREERRPW